MVEIRAFRPADLEDLYRICLATAVGGDDATAFYRDPRLVGHVYAAPYAALSPLTVFVAEDPHGVGGYIVGAPDTRDFETRLETQWWPGLRKLCRDPSDEPRAGWSADQLMSYRIHHPSSTTAAITGPYPAHLHIHLMPHLRGLGVGRRLMDRWLGTVRDMGACGAHLAVGAANRRAVRFYRACGFREMEQPPRAPSAALWFVINLAPKVCGKEHARA